MKVYLDTTILIALLFGELSEIDQERQPVVEEWFQVANALADLTIFTSLYALQELVIFVYENYPPTDASTVLRLAILTLFQNKLTLLPLLNRIDILKYRRQVSIPDRSDVPHVALTLKNDCDYLVTYDEHFSNVSEVEVVKPEDLLPVLQQRRSSTSEDDGQLEV